MADFPLYTWDPRLQRYRSKRTGQLVSQAAVRRALDAALENERRRTRGLAEQLRVGTLSQRQWERGMRDMVKRTQLYSAAAAKGGWGRLTPEDYGRVGARVGQQYAFLDGFSQELQTGLPRDGRFLARAQLYAEAGRRVYHDVEREVRLEAGDTEERNVLHQADHCDATDPSSCPAQSARGWVPIGALIPIGGRLCGPNCRCTVEYRGVA